MNTESDFKNNLTQNKFVPISQLEELSNEDRHIPKMGMDNILKVADEIQTEFMKPRDVYTCNGYHDKLVEWLEPVNKHNPITDPTHPFTDAEDEIMQHLLKAQVLFVNLPKQNKNAATDFLSHIRDCRRILAMRVLAREFVEYEVES